MLPAAPFPGPPSECERAAGGAGSRVGEVHRAATRRRRALDAAVEGATLGEEGGRTRTLVAGHITQPASPTRAIFLHHASPAAWRAVLSRKTAPAMVAPIGEGLNH